MRYLNLKRALALGGISVLYKATRSSPDVLIAGRGKTTRIFSNRATPSLLEQLVGSR